MGHKAMDAERLREQESNYSIVAFPAAKLPIRYQAFILAKWKRSLRSGNDYFKLIDPNSFYKAYDRYTQLLLARPDSIIRIAVLSDDPDVALGWSLIEGDTLHYVFVQAEQRNKGIAKNLVPVKINWFTHLTHTGARIWSKHKEVKLDPFR